MRGKAKLKSLFKLSCHLTGAIFKSGNEKCGNGNGEWGTGNGESLKPGIFKMGNL